MERDIQQRWIELQLDPCIDFQILLSIRNDYDRFYYLSQMIVRERQRLEDVIRSTATDTVTSSTTTSQEDVDTFTEKNEVPIQKGAWFNDEYW